MGISRADLLKELVPGLEALFGLEHEVYTGPEYANILDWLQENHRDVADRWGIYSGTYGVPQTYENLHPWLTDNHPELIPMIDLLLAAQCE